MRRVNLGWDRNIPDQTMLNAIEAIFKALGYNPTLTIGEGVTINGLPEGNIYVETIHT